MGSLIEELKRREAAARAEADGLRARIGELSGDLARAGKRASLPAITREEVTRVLEEPPAADTARQDGAPAGKPGPPSLIGAVTVPPRQEGTGASVLPRAYQDLVEVAEDAGRPLRAAEFAAATGLAAGKAKVEGLRSKLKLPAARVWLAGAPGGPDWKDADAPGPTRAVRYLGNKRELLRYGQALDADWPIATGVIEGACRHLPVN